jgi:hypothetical protein
MSDLSTCSSPNEARNRYPDLASVVDTIASAFSVAAENKVERRLR